MKKKAVHTDHGFFSLFIEFKCHLAIFDEEGKIEEVLDALSKASRVDETPEKVHPTTVFEECSELNEKVSVTEFKESKQGSPWPHLTPSHSQT